MKTFFAIVLLAAVVFLWQRSHQAPATPNASTARSSTDATTGSAQISPGPEVKPHGASQNWVKRPIDRAREVADQVRKQSEQNQQP